MTDDVRLMLIDGHALIHRAFHAIPEGLSTSSGEVTNAVFGFANILFKEIEAVRPTHIAMAFDRPVPTFRHEAYAGYKATRPPTPSALKSQFGRVRELADTMHIPIYELDGFEADDVLGTLSLQAERAGIETVIVTGDLDAAQLVSDKVHVLTPARGITETALYDPDAVRRRYGIEPRQLPDWKALVGDKSDNILGVPGIGDKSASDLVARFSSLEGIYEHLDELRPKQRELLETYKDQAFDSRELAAIVRDAPVTLALDECAREQIDRARLIELLTELEFRSLIPRVQALLPRAAASATSGQTESGGPTQLSMFGDAPPPPRSHAVVESTGPEGTTVTAVLDAVRPTSDEQPTVTRVVHDEDDLRALVQELENARSFALDTETTSTDPLQARLVGLSFATVPGRAWYVPVGHSEGKQLALETVLHALRPVLQNAAARKIGHNLKYDLAVLEHHGLPVGGLDFDTMIAAYLVNPTGRGLSLSALALARLAVEMVPIEALIGKGKSQVTMDRVEIATVAGYAGADADVTLRLRDLLLEDLRERDLVKLFEEVEMPLVEVLARMELVGVALDTDVLEAMSRDMAETIGRLEERIYQRAGRRFNINSTQQLGQLLFVELKLPSGRRTKTGYSTDSEVLEGLRGKDPMVDDILEYRQLIKLKSTYIDALPSIMDPGDRRIHTDFNQTVAATGRLSSSNPNLQNIPIRGEIGRRIRQAFVPGEPGKVLLAADYSQIELRILASMSGDPRLMEAFLTGQDVHRATAAAVFNVPLAEVSAEQRRIAKVVNFGIIYGIGEQRLAHETGISRQDAAEFIASYNATYAGVKSFMDNLKKQAAFHGYVSTLLNRRRYLPDIHSSHPGIRSAAERAAINMPVQGTAADIIKVAMIRLHHELPRVSPDAEMVLQVHDELVFTVPRPAIEQVAALVRDTMEGAVPLNVPLEVEIKVGDDWYDMEPLELAG